MYFLVVQRRLKGYGEGQGQCWGEENQGKLVAGQKGEEGWL